jgi:TPP-dependent trihydroxycyclohexane-1,2-dione (THcHDO) dehydratase
MRNPEWWEVGVGMVSCQPKISEVAAALKKAQLRVKGQI